MLKLVQWGDTFRPAYYRLGMVRSALLQSKPEGTKLAIAAFTATANPDAQQTIQRVLQLQQPEIFRLNPYRANLHLNVQVVWTPQQRRQQLLSFIRAQAGQAGLVYVRTRRDSEALAAWLSQHGFQTAAYHAGLSPDERRQMEKAWLGGSTQFVVCTCAFGMGIDKPNVRWVVHFHSPLLGGLCGIHVVEKLLSLRFRKTLSNVSSKNGSFILSEDSARTSFCQPKAQIAPLIASDTLTVEQFTENRAKWQALFEVSHI